MIVVCFSLLGPCATSSLAYLRFDPSNPPMQVFRTERGGEPTYHGPGQLVIYPILDLRQFQPDLHWYARQLEQVALDTLATFGISGHREESFTGVFVGHNKVAAIGIRARRQGRNQYEGKYTDTPHAHCASFCFLNNNKVFPVLCSWVTFHGMAINVAPFLGDFDHIVPCGIRNKGVTSIEKECADAARSMAVASHDSLISAVAEVVVRSFATNFDVEVSPSPSAIASSL